MQIRNQPLPNPIFWAFLISFIYWVYLALTSRMIIAFDACNYEDLGRILSGKHWLDYFLNGPGREPFYPLLISISMRLGNFFSFPYQMIQVFLQFLILFITQLLILRILRLLKISVWISTFTVFYLGVSPAMVNSALSLYSEIATYPLILAIILLMYKSWVSFPGQKAHIITLAIASGLTFVLMTLNKGIFEVITPVFVSLFFLSTLLTRNKQFILNAMKYLVIFSVVFYTLIMGYKLTNKILNGNFMITGRGGLTLYGSAARRVEPLTPERFLTALAYVPGEGICKSIFGQEKCYFWSLFKINEFGLRKIGELEAMGLRAEEIEKGAVRAALNKILQNPAQFNLLWFIEGFKMLFWESTQIGYVAYSPALTKFFCWLPLRNGLRFLMSILTFAALAYLVNFLLRERKNLFLSQGNIKIILFLIFLLIFLFCYAYALCIIIPRYAFPIVPLYLIIIAFAFQKICLISHLKTNTGNTPTRL